MSNTKPAMALLASLFVAACGGGGSSSGLEGMSTGIVSAPSPSASPTASPSPAPSAATTQPIVIANSDSNARGVALLGGGTRVAAWSDSTGVHSQLFDAQGARIAGAVAIAPSGIFTGVAALPGGRYAVEYGQPDAVRVQIVGASGELAGAAVVVRTQAQVEADLAGTTQPVLVGGAGVFTLADGGFAAEYRTSHAAHIPGDFPGELMVQRYSAQGSPIGEPIAVASEAPAALAASSATPAGGLVTATTELCPCFASGTARAVVQDSNLQIAAYFEKTPGQNTTSQSAAGLANGNFVMVWTVTSPATQVQGQVFALDGSTVSRTRAVTPVITFANAAAGARVTALAGGGFLLSWGAAAQAFDALGQPTSGVMQILDGSIAATPDGGFVVVAQLGSQLVEQAYTAGP